MWDFDWKDMQVLMVINALNSSDEDEARLAEKLTESYNSSKVNKKVLEMPQIRKIISDFWAEVKERREVMSISGKGKRKGKDKGKMKRTREGEKENKTKMRNIPGKGNIYLSSRKRKRIWVKSGE